jgi:nucleoside-diphosphate-sugar epimerase
MTILVLGSAGQIGKPTCEYLIEMGHDVIYHDIVNDHLYQDLRHEYSRTFENDMRECDFVYYFASDVGGAKYLEQHEHTYRFISDNMRIMVNVFTMLKRFNKPFLFTSSQMSELGHSSYGMLKKLGEHMTNDIGGLVVRLWNVYGPEHEEEKAHVITDFCKMAKNDGVINMRTDGLESRQLLYARDCAECFLTLTNLYDTLDKSKNYHITNFEWVSILDVANQIKEISGCEVVQGTRKDLTQMNAMNPPDPYILKFWKPRTTLKEGLKIIYDQTH